MKTVTLIRKKLYKHLGYVSVLTLYILAMYVFCISLMFFLENVKTKTVGVLLNLPFADML